MAPAAHGDVPAPARAQFGLVFVTGSDFLTRQAGRRERGAGRLNFSLDGQGMMVTWALVQASRFTPSGVMIFESTSRTFCAS